MPTAKIWNLEKYLKLKYWGKGVAQKQSSCLEYPKPWILPLELFPKLQNLTFRASLMECLQWLCRAGRAFLLGVGCDPALHFFHC